MLCKSCNYPHSQVVETKKDTKTNQIIRRRECIKCGVRFTTQEHVHSRPNYKTPIPRKVLEK
jgi:transcriptional regulator NrdR family protein